jgi:hypothetical protein
MEKQTRWWCDGCQRQWAIHSHEQGYASGALEIDYSIKPEPQAVPWDPAHGCPICHSLAIRLVTFTAAFPGGDFLLEPLAPPPPVRPIVVPERRNTTIAASSPELG